MKCKCSISDSRGTGCIFATSFEFINIIDCTVYKTSEELHWLNQ